LTQFVSLYEHVLKWGVVVLHIKNFKPQRRTYVVKGLKIKDYEFCP